MSPDRARRAFISLAIVGLSSCVGVLNLDRYFVSRRNEFTELKAAVLEHIRCSYTPEKVVAEIQLPPTALTRRVIPNFKHPHHPKVVFGRRVWPKRTSTCLTGSGKLPSILRHLILHVPPA